MDAPSASRSTSRRVIPPALPLALRGPGAANPNRAATGSLQILPFGVGRNRLEQAIANTGVDARLVRDLGGAEVVMTLRSFFRRRPRLLRDAEARGTPVYVLRSNTVLQMESCLTEMVEAGRGGQR